MYEVADCMDRDQLHFDRVHISILILHQRRYFSRSRHRVKTLSHISLQYAMKDVGCPLVRSISASPRDSLPRNEVDARVTELAQQRA